MKILCVIAGSCDESVTATAVQYAANAMQARGADVQILDLRSTPLPIFNPSSKDSTEHYARIKAMVDAADGYILGTPDYHGSMSGTLKNFLDYFWTEFAGKVFGYVCSSFEKGLTTMDHVRTIIRQCYGWSMPYGVSLTENDVNEACEVINASVQQRLNMLARDLVVYGTLITQQRMSDLQSDEAATFIARYRG